MPTGDAMRALDVPRRGRGIVVTGDADRESGVDLLPAAERSGPKPVPIRTERADRAGVGSVAIIAGGVR